MTPNFDTGIKKIDGSPKIHLAIHYGKPKGDDLGATCLFVVKLEEEGWGEDEGHGGGGGAPDHPERNRDVGRRHPRSSWHPFGVTKR